LVLTCLLTFLFNRIFIDPDDIQFQSLRSQLRGGGGDGDDCGNLTSSITNYDLLTTDNFDPNTANPDLTIPECLPDVFFPLRRTGERAKEIGDDNNDDNEQQQHQQLFPTPVERNSPCWGMLIRDDIILTTSQCSQITLFFDFPDEKVGSIEANPLILEEHELEKMDPRLGFLKANKAPDHHYFVEESTKRTRMFLSLISNPVNGNGNEDDDHNNGGGADVLMTCDDRNRPTAHNFPVDNTNGTTEAVPLSHLAHVVPHDILWKERDMATAPVLVDDHGHRSWTKAVSLDAELKKFSKLMDEYQGPPGSVSIPDAHNDNKQVSKTGALCEAVDPRGHRRQDCFKNYFFRWRHATPFGGMHFFDWLDFGEGRDLMETNDTETMIFHKHSDLKCFRESFDRKKVHYFDDEEREKHEVVLKPSEDGRELVARYKRSDEPVPENYEDDAHLYVWDLENKLYVVDHNWDSVKYGKIKHTAVLAGRPALSAGEVYFGKGGRLTGINWSSGHYRPGITAVSTLYQWMKNEGFNATSLNWMGRSSWNTVKCLKNDWDNVKLPGYNSTSLLRSCLEVTSGPMWFRKEEEDDR